MFRLTSSKDIEKLSRSVEFYARGGYRHEQVFQHICDLSNLK